ncbi:dihydrofolate reductase [Roseivirga misakiensis]|uniref:dihydrofolate reductase n=1 Tax=Roseivirga misakiensis TaxID=1563681 RepID=UPI000A51AACB|nr:dihydrofolate reductase [Roseivirga misakiensis]
MISTIVVAKAKNNAIGKNNDLLWRLPDDFKFFKQVTLDHFVILGRKTFESLPGLLPRRTFVIITRQKEYQAPEGHFVAHSLEEAYRICQEQTQQEVFVIGGGVIYKESIDKGLIDKMFITEVDANIEDADTFFPEFSMNEWKEVAREYHSADDKHEYAFDFVTYSKV